MVSILKTVGLYDSRALAGGLEEKKVICIPPLLFFKSDLQWI